MKKIITLSLLIMTTTGMLAQKTIENPDFSASTAPYVKIERIVLHDTSTIIDFEVEYFPGWWIRIEPNKTYIQNSEGGEKLYVKSAQGIEFNEKHTTPESGINRFSLYFPAVDDDAKTIDFIEEGWKIFDIKLLATKTPSFLPETLQGNWYKTDGSNEWVYGIYKDKIIYKSTVWDNILVNDKGKNFELILKKGSKQESLFIKVKKDKLLIGSTPKSLQLLSRTETYIPGYTLEDDEEFIEPVFNQDTAILTGFLKGYHPKMEKTGILYVSDILNQDQSSYIIELEQDGSFSCKVPMIYPQQVLFRMLGMNESIFLDPGKSTFVFIDLSKQTLSNKTHKKTRELIFMGDNARLNKDLMAMDTISYFDYYDMRDKILDMNAEEYKEYCMNILKKEQDALDLFVRNNKVSKKALQVKHMQIHFGFFMNILSYNMNRSSAYRQKHNVPRTQREIPLKPVISEPAYFSFIEAEELNDPLALLAGSDYYFLLNRVSFADCVRPGPNFFYAALKETVEKEGIAISEKESEILDTLAACNDRDSINTIIARVSADWNLFMMKNQELIKSTGLTAYDRIQYKNIARYFGLEKGLAFEIMQAQNFCSTIKGNQKPLSEEDIVEMKKKITNPFIVDYLLNYSDAMAKEIEEKLAAAKSKTGYIVNKTPETEADKLFEAIIEKYKGKVIFVDFWATWCGPCRSGMEKMKPLKEEMKDEDIVFVYITNPSSPVDTWNMMIPDIKGEHYRVSQDEWNHLSSKFNITGIPHYVLVDKSGNVVNRHVYFASSVDELKKLFKEYMKE